MSDDRHRKNHFGAGAMCQHGRMPGQICPWCTGINKGAEKMAEKDKNNRALLDALKRVIQQDPGSELSDNDVIQLLAHVVGGVASLEKRISALEERQKRDGPAVWA